MSAIAWFLGAIIANILVSSFRDKRFRLLDDGAKREFEIYWKRKVKKADKITHYDVLNVLPNARLSEIEKAYDNALKKYQSASKDKDSALQITKIKNAYNILSDKGERADYDAGLMYEPEEIVLVGYSVQQLRLLYSQDLKIASKSIKFTQRGNVFIDGKFVYCWCETHGYFVLYKPKKMKDIKFNPVTDEVIFLSSYTQYELQQMIAIDFGCDNEDIELSYDGNVYKNGEFAFCWRLLPSGFYEYYIPAEGNIDDYRADEEDWDELDLSDDEEIMEELKKSEYCYTLGVQKDANFDEIKKAYRKLAQKYHPDHNKGNKESEKKFRKIKEAYEILKDEYKC